MNILDAQDAALAGNTQYERFLMEFEARWNAPLMEMQMAQTAQGLKAVWEQMPPEMKVQMQAVNPQMYAELEQTLKELGDGQNKNGVYPAVAGRDVGKGG